MKKIRINVLILAFIAFLGIANGAESHDEIINELKALQKKLGFIYGRSVHGDANEKVKACDEMEEVCKKIEEELATIPLQEVKDYVSIDIKTIQEKIASFRRSRNNLGGCSEVFESDFGPQIFEAYLGADENTVTGLRGLLNILIGHLKSKNS